MGNWFTSIFDRNLPSKQDVQILILGLENVGKTTLLYQMKLGEVIITIPTIGFNVESVEYKNLSFTMWDISGQVKIRRLWSYYFTGTHGLIYVIDSADMETLEESKKELIYLLQHKALKNVHLLIFANKTDLPESLALEELVEYLELKEYAKDRCYFIIKTCALNGEGLEEGIEWISSQIAIDLKNDNNNNNNNNDNSD
eukprot:TRINITY_DN1042_c0_g1_i1.p1 TRINITY_DN1042_c0_g1~~TRINITY_DN1042_c0_g1_i1.p1  ORF type:complete len:199 (+),score=48.39 TRINITY_DN1042_c0_g1_i1:208-804(+)